MPNEQAIRLATQAARALGCTVHTRSIFARKNYFYPDLPKGYQISQFDQPLATGGTIWCESPERGRIGIGVTRLHLEEDAGKSLHDRLPGKTAIDLNRAGTPLVEIVSSRTSAARQQARAYLTTLKQILVYAEVSDCNMEEGSLRVDANISIRRPGDSKLGTKAEVKNMNSFANVERALIVERDRQVTLLESGGRVEQVTMLFNAASGTVKPMRSKEESHDYRYFPDRICRPLVLLKWDRGAARGPSQLPEPKQERFAMLCPSPPTMPASSPRAAGGDYFEAVVGAGAEAKSAANWVMGEAMSWQPDRPIQHSAEAALETDRIGQGERGQSPSGQAIIELVNGNEEPGAVADSWD